MGKTRPMAGMGVVHRHHIRDHPGITHKAGIVGDCVQPAMGLNQIHGVVDIAEAHGEFVFNWRIPRSLPHIRHLGRQFGDGKAMAGAAILGSDSKGAGKQSKKGEEKGHRTILHCRW